MAARFEFEMGDEVMALAIVEVVAVEVGVGEVVEAAVGVLTAVDAVVVIVEGEGVGL